MFFQSVNGVANT